MRGLTILAALGLALVLGSCAEPGAPRPAPSRVAAPAPVASAAPAAEAPGPGVRATLLPAAPQASVRKTPPSPAVRAGDVSLNFPGVDVQIVAKAVLGDMLGVQYSLAPDLHTPVTVVTSRPIARADVFRFVEAAFAAGGVAMTNRGGVYMVLPVEQARGQAPVVEGGVPGFATEEIKLAYVGAEQFRKLIDPVLPNVITNVDPARNVIFVAGSSGQRASVRDLVRQFDVNWLRNTSFALFVPQRTDSRLIVSSLDRLINADNAPTKGLVHLIAMDRLNGILAITTQPQYLEDVRRWIEVLDHEGESSERRIFVYRVQNGRSSDLAKVLANAFGANARNDRPRTGPEATPVTRDDLTLPGTPPGGSGGLGGSGGAQPGGLGSSGGGLQQGLGSGGGQSSGATSVDIQSDDLKVKISSDETNNAIVVYGTPRDYAVVEEALRKLDVTPYQVMIEAAITEVTLTDALRYGVQWQFAKGRDSTSLSEGATGTPVSIFPGFSFFHSGNSISAALNALESLTKINVVSAPKLMVLNNQTATLQVGDQVPIVTSSAVSTVGSNSPIVNAVEYRDTGIILKITPRVNSSGMVLLDVAQEVSDVTPTTTSNINSPTISTRKIATSIAVQDGEVIALGGLISNSQTNGKAGLPYLSRIPVLSGLLFGKNDNHGTRTELLVLLRPRVIRNVDDGRALTEDLREKLQALKPLMAKEPFP